MNKGVSSMYFNYAQNIMKNKALQKTLRQVIEDVSKLREYYQIEPINYENLPPPNKKEKE
jgi:hypothetical protein